MTPPPATSVTTATTAPPATTIQKRHKGRERTALPELQENWIAFMIEVVYQTRARTIGTRREYGWRWRTLFEKYKDAGVESPLDIMMQPARFYKSFKTTAGSDNTRKNWITAILAAFRGYSFKYAPKDDGNVTSSPDEPISNHYQHQRREARDARDARDAREARGQQTENIKKKAAASRPWFKIPPETEKRFKAQVSRWKAAQEDRASWKAAYEEWLKYMRFVGATLNAQDKLNLPSERQAKQITSYEEIDAKYAELSKNHHIHDGKMSSMGFVLLSFYVHQVPKRADLGDVIVLEVPPRTSEEAASFRGKNYIVLPPQEVFNVAPPSSRPNNKKKGIKSLAMQAAPVLVMDRFKTVATLGTIEEALKPEFVQDARASLRKHPRRYLFERADGQGALTANEFTHFVQRTFATYFGRPTGPSVLRHAYISEKIDWRALSDAQLEAIARLMGHTTSMQRAYRWKS